MTFEDRQNLEDLQRIGLSVMEQLSKLSEAARKSKERKLTRPASDLYYAANRAWHELDNQVTAIAKLLSPQPGGAVAGNETAET